MSAFGLYDRNILPCQDVYYSFTQAETWKKEIDKRNFTVISVSKEENSK